MNLCDTRTIKQIMGMYGLHFKKEFGQNFLTEKFVVEDIATIAATTATQPSWKSAPVSAP